MFLLKSGSLGIETEVDALRRKIRTWQWDTSPEVWTKVLRERFVYGEGVTDAAGMFLLGRLYRIYDGAGKVELAYDWKGQTAATTRTFLLDDEDQGDWSSIDTSYPYDPNTPDDATAIAALETAAASLLDASYVTADTFDAVGRTVARTTPDDSVTTNTYDIAGRLQTVTVTADSVETSYVTGITYNPKGQRLTITYGNSTDTAYTYDPDTFRLATLVTTRSTDSKKLQDLRYTYDPVGNIVGLENAADDDVYYDNTAVSPNSAFVYDALYRLVSATGREKGDRAQPWSSDPSFLDIPNTEELRTYTELYTYDEVGNISEMVHKHGATTLWTRDYAYATDSNRLASTTEAPGTVSYAHDARGNMVYLPWMRFSSTQAANVEVNLRDQMCKVYLNADDTAFYFYDSAGQRVRKVVKTGPVQDRKYVGGYEVWTKRSAGGTLLERRTTLHVMDDQARIAMIEKKTDGTDAPLTRVRFQLGNHLGTACVEVNEDGEIISYEEYHPYGSTAWWSSNGDVEVSQKRYRYTGMERDEETGLQCHGVRYYAPWLGRWTSADPIGLGDGVNRFCYCHGGPVGGRDSTGMRDDDIPPGMTVDAYGECLGTPVRDPTYLPPSTPETRLYDLLHPLPPLVQGPIIDRIRPQFDVGDLEHGPFGPAGTVAAAEKLGLAFATGDESYLRFTPGQQFAIGLADVAATSFGVGIALRGQISDADLLGRGQTTSQPITRPQGLTPEQFERAGQIVRGGPAGGYSEDIGVQGSRSTYSAKATSKPDTRGLVTKSEEGKTEKLYSDIDIAVRVTPQRFKELLNIEWGKPPNPGSANEKTMNRAIESGKIQSGEAGLSSTRKALEEALGLEVDISVIQVGGPFDQGPYLQLPR